MKRAALALLLALVVAPAAASAATSRVAIVEPAHPDAVVREAITRLRAELTAAGFTVTVSEGPPVGEHPFATIAVARTDRGAVADVWTAGRLTRVDTGDTAEAGATTALAIRAVEVLRASLVEAEATPPPVPRAPRSDAPRWTVPPEPPRPPRALLERVALGVGLAALYGLGDTGGRLAPTFRFSYGAAFGLAGQLTVMGPTATDQLFLAELAYGADRSFRTLAPYVSLSGGAIHSTIEATGQAQLAAHRTRLWAAVMGGSAGVAARATDRTAFLFDLHVLAADPTAGSVIDGAPVAGHFKVLVTAALGVVAGF
jgi:hypothetical protein